MKRADLIYRRARMDAQLKNIEFYRQIPGTPKALIDRAYEEITKDWSLIRTLIAIRQSNRNKKNEGYRLAKKMAETSKFESIAEEIDKGVHNSIKTIKKE